VGSVPPGAVSNITRFAPDAGLNDSDACGFHNRTDEVLTLATADLSGKRVMLAALTRCTVHLHGVMTALHADGLAGCRVSCGTVAGATFISDCTDSQFSVACHQLRVHRTRDTSFYLHVTSRAIIEDCTGITTAPYVMQYEGLGAQLDAAGLDPERNSWDQLDDFNWLASNEPSPNWSVLDIDRRIKWSV